MADTREPVNSGVLIPHGTTATQDKFGVSHDGTKDIVSACNFQDFIASEEFWPDIDGDKTSDSAWHFWLDKKYDQEQRRKWLEEHRAPQFRNLVT